MYFLIDPIYRPDKYLSYADEINRAYEGESSVALATLLKPAAGSFDSTGAKLFIRDDGTTEGTLGSADLDAEALNKSSDLMIHGNNEYIVSLNGAEYFIEAYTTPPQLVLCGGGHVSNAIAPMAKKLGFHVFITDDRKEFANKERFPEADMIVDLKPEDAFPELPINRNTFIIIATRGHRYDNVALAAAVDTSAKYVGLLGSKRKTVLIYEDLIRSGVDIERIKQIRSPVGLDIHARTPDEIAVSIIAEILMFKLGGTGAPMKIDEWRVDKIRDKVGETISVVE